MFGLDFPHHGSFLPFYELLKQVVGTIDKPFKYIQGDLHEFTFSNPFPLLNNFQLVSVDMGRLQDPMEVSVDSNSKVPFKLKRRPRSIIPA